MWKKDGSTVLLTFGLLTLVLLFCIFSEALLKYSFRELEEILRQVFTMVFGTR